MNKLWQVALFMLVCAALGLGIGKLVSDRLVFESKRNLVTDRPAPAPVLPPHKERVTLAFAGDIMTDRGVESSAARNFGGDFAKFFENVPLIREADFAFGNLEGPVSDVGNNVGSKFSFRMDPKTIPALVSAGIDAVSFANNHVGDWTAAAFRDTLARLDAAGIKHSGAGQNLAEASSPVILEKDGIKIGIIGCSDVGPQWLRANAATPGIVICQDEHLYDYIRAADSQVDVLVFTAHWGEEYVPANARQEKVARAAIDAGADLVVGHHPHVIQKTEYYKGKLIAYSLGNFVFDQGFSSYVDRGMILSVTVDEDGAIAPEFWTVVRDKKTHQPILVRPFEETDAVLSKDANAGPFTCPKPAVANRSDLWLEPVGPDHGVDDYVPSGLVKASDYATVSSTTICVTTDAANALKSLFAAMKAEKLSPMVSSGYRSSDYQKTLRANSVQSNTPGAYPSVALPGHSEHQLGVAVDIVAAPKYTLDDFAETPEYAWLSKNAADYGFVQSYEEGKEKITGYTPESWHWRFVGIERAREIKDERTTAFEYLSE